MLPDQVPLAKTRVYRELNLKNSALADDITSCAERVFGELGPGFSPAICEEALAIEFLQAAIAFKKGHPVWVSYRGQHIGEQRFNFVVEDRFAVKLMAAQDDEELQTLHFRAHLKACNLEAGLLLNLATGAFFVKRIGREVLPGIADVASGSGPAISRASPFQTSPVSALGPDGLLSIADGSESPAGGFPRHLGGRPRRKWWMWLGVFAVLATLGTLVIAVALPAVRLQRARAAMEGRFVQSGYLDPETSKRLVAALVKGPDTSTAAEIANAAKFLCDALSNSDLLKLQSEAAATAVRKLEGKEGDSLRVELVPLRDVVREVRVLCDTAKVFADSRDPKELEGRLERWLERISKLRSSTFLNVQLFRAEYLVSLISANAESDCKKRTALAQAKE